MQSRRRENIFVSALMVLALCGFLAFCEGRSYAQADASVAQNEEVTISMNTNND